MAPTREPFASVHAAPGRFVLGFGAISLVMVGLAVLLIERNFGLWLGLQAGFQGAAYMWLLKSCRAKANRA